MTTDRYENPVEGAENGVLDEISSTDTTGLGIVEGATAHVEVLLPTLHSDDSDDGVVDDDIVDEAVFEPVGRRDEASFEPAGRHADDDVTSEIRAAEARVAEARSVERRTAEAVRPITVETEVVPEAEKEPVRTVAAPAASRGPVEQHHDRARPRTSEIALQSRRLGDLAPERETDDLLTADRLLDPAHVVRPEPQGGWRRLVYRASGRRINLGDDKRTRARKELDARITAPLAGRARFTAVLSRKGGVGKTTVTSLLGMALADARDDRVIAVDANPDRGTLAERVGRASGKTVRDLVRDRDTVHGFNDISQIVARDVTRLDVLASDADPHVSEAFSDIDYDEIADIAAHFYSIVLTDTGTGIVHSVMEATLRRADQLVIVAGLSVDEARLASETLTWLETNGHADRARSAIVVLNTARPGAQLVRADELETHFRTRVRAVVRVPYDQHIAAGSVISFRELHPATREAARRLAAHVIESLRSTS